jgi:hypothetical protein
MDTKKVRELLRRIETAEAKLQELGAARTELDERIKAQDELTLDLKRQLAAELREVVGPVRGPGGRGKRRSGDRRALGLSKALLEVLKDGKPHGTADLQRAVEAKGISGHHVSPALAYLAKKGRARRVSRGEYTKA